MTTGERLSDIHRIAVLRGGGIGDTLFAVPAIAALHGAYPDAELAVIADDSAALLEGRLPFPIRVVSRAAVADAVIDAGARREALVALGLDELDLALQLHGGGRESNPLTLGLGARHTAGCATPDAVSLERTLPYAYYQHEMLRGLEVAGLVGAAPVELEPRLRPLPADRASAASLLRELVPGWGDGPHPVAVIHPGASDPRRRWPPERFGAVAAALAAEGCAVLVVGTAAEASIAEEVVEAAGTAGVVSVAGTMGLGTLVGVLAASELVVANDSGPRHLAQAVGAATVSIYWIGNVVNAAPLRRREHRVRIGWRTSCPVCGADATQVGWTAPRCPHDPSFVDDVQVAGVLEDALSLLRPAGLELVRDDHLA